MYFTGEPARSPDVDDPLWHPEPPGETLPGRGDKEEGGGDHPQDQLHGGLGVCSQQQKGGRHKVLIYF